MNKIKLNTINSKNSIFGLLGGFLPISNYLINTNWKEIDSFTLIGLLFLVILGVVFFIYYVRITREIYFNDEYISIKPIFSNNFENVNYSDVIELKEMGIYISKLTTRSFSLEYKSGGIRKKIHFDAKIDGKLTELKNFILTTSPTD